MDDSSLTTLESTGIVVQDFWKRKEGLWTKKIVIAAAAIVGITAFLTFGVWLPILMGIIVNYVEFGCLLAGIAVVTSPLWHPDVKRIFSERMQNLIRAAYYKLAQKDPIGTLKNYQDALGKEEAHMSQSVSELSGGKVALERDNEKQRDYILQQMDMHTAAQQAWNKAQAKLRTNPKMTANDKQELLLGIQELEYNIQEFETNAGNADDTIRDNTRQLEQINYMYEQMCRMRNLAQFKIRGLKNKIESLARRRANMQATQKALGSGLKIMRGDPKQVALVDMAYEVLETETSQTLGALRDFNRDSGKYLTGMDMQNAANAEQGKRVFDALVQKLNLPESVVGEGEAAVPAVMPEAEGNSAVGAGAAEAVPAYRPRAIAATSVFDKYRK